MGNVRVHILGMLVVICLMGSSCRTQYNLGGVKETRIPEDFELMIQRGACFGTCPTYDLWVDALGEVKFDGHQYAPYEGVHEKEIPLEDVRQLVFELIEFRFFEFEDIYDDPQISDLPTFRTTVTMDGRQHTVINRYGAPARLDSLQCRLLEVIDLSRGFQELPER